MKKIFIAFFSIISISVIAQSPQLISFQGIARNSSGVAITNQSIGIGFRIYQGSITGTLIYSETHNTITTNNLGLFTAFIGGGATTDNFTAIDWANGPFFIEISIDPTGTGSSYTTLGSQQLLSVPYALYAEKAGNASPTPTITGSGLAIVTPTTGSLFTVAVPTSSLNYTSATNVLSLTQGTAITTVTLMGSGSNTVSITGLGATTVTPNGAGSVFTINTPSYTAGSGINISGGVISNTATSLWAASGNTLYPTSAMSIGIGTTTPNSPFQVASYISFENNGSNTSLGYNTGTGTSPNNFYNTFVGLNAGQTVGTGSASANTFIGYHSGKTNLNGSNNTMLGANSGVNNTVGNNNTFIGAGADILSSTQHTNAAAIGYNAKVDADNAMVLGDGTVNVGIGTNAPGFKLEVDELTNALPAITAANSAASSSSLAIGIYGTSNSTSTLSAGVKGGNGGSGVAILGQKPSSATAGNAGRFEILGPVTTNTADAIFAETKGAGASVFAVKTSSIGISGRFEIQNISNSADAIYAKTIGTGSAIHAVCGPTVTGSSNVALNIDNGHLKSTGTNVAFTSTITTLQTYTVTGNDVAGKISVLTSTLTPVPIGQELISITFNKPFATGVIPVIMLTPTSPSSSALQVYVASSTNTGFVIKNNIASSLSTSYSFNYFVIE